MLILEPVLMLRGRFSSPVSSLARLRPQAVSHHRLPAVPHQTLGRESFALKLSRKSQGYSSFWAIYLRDSGTYHLVASLNRCQKSWKADKSRDSTIIIPLYDVPQIWAYSLTIATSFDNFFLNRSHSSLAFLLSASVNGLTR